MGKQNILLSLVEPVQLIHEKNGFPPVHAHPHLRLGYFSRMSATLDSTPLSIMKWAFVVRAMTAARVVFPHPGGP